MKKQNRAERVLAFLEQRPNIWVEAVRFEPLGGRQAWRTALSEARKLAKAKGGDIVNRTRQQQVGDKTWTLSEYMLVPKVDADPGPVSRGHDVNQPWSLQP